MSAAVGAKVTVLDISDKQLQLAEQKIAQAGVTGQIEKFLRADICDLSMFQDGTFDIVICFGGALSYVCERRQQAAGELIRVARSGGIILVSVMSLLGPLVGEAQIPDIPNLQNPDGNAELPGIWPVLETGNLSGVYSTRLGMKHAPMHLYTAEELKALFKGCEVKEIAASNAVLREFSPVNEQLAAEPAAWATVVELEKKLNHMSGLIDTGSHTILAAIKEETAK